MNLLDSILSANGGGAVQQLARQFGLSEDQASSAVANLVPALAGGFQKNISQGGLDDLLGALTKGQHERYLEDPSILGREEVRDEGNGILGHIFGSKDVSRQVAARASAQTGIGESILKQMLPAVAALAMGALSKGSSGAPAASNRGGSVLDLLTPLLGGGGGPGASGLGDLIGSIFKK